MPLQPVADGTGGGEKDSPPVSPWEDATSFHTKGREETAVPVAGRIPNATARALARIVQSGKFPGIETTSDALRDALWRWTRWAADLSQDEEMAKELDLQRRRWRVEAEEQRLVQIDTLVDSAERVLENPNAGETSRRKVLTELSALALVVEESLLRRRIIQLTAKHR